MFKEQISSHSVENYSDKNGSKYRSAEELPMAAIVNGSGRNQQSL
jgi:hypothetical protein